MLGQNLTPEYQVTTGIRRMSNDQANAFASLGIDVTQEVIDKNRWYAFWDAPFSIPGYTPQPTGRGGRRAARRHRAAAPATPTLGQGGTSLSRSQPFSREPRQTGLQPIAESSRLHGRPRLRSAEDEGRNPPRDICVLRFVMRCQERRQQSRGDVPRNEARHLRRQSPVHGLSRNEPHSDGRHCADQRAVGGLQVRRRAEGILDGDDAQSHLARHRRHGQQQHQFGGPKAIGLSGIRAANRLLVAEGPRGSVATFPPPHTFFFTREVDVNLGYVFYRNDGGGTYSIGVTMPEAESDTFPQYEQNYALYNAPPGTWQKMSMYFYASPEPGEATRQAALAFTHERRLQGGSGLQDVRQSLPSPGGRSDARGRVRHAASGSDGDEGDRPQRHRLERFPCG